LLAPDSSFATSATVVTPCAASGFVLRDALVPAMLLAPMGAQPRVFVTRRLPGSALERLQAAHDVEVWPGRTPPPRAELLARAPELDGLLSLLTDPVDAELICAAPRLRAISNYAVGVDNVDLEAAAARGIPVGNTPDVLTESTADLALALMLGIARRLAEGEAFVKAGEWVTWEPSLMLGRDLHGATVGIVGYGRIGQAVGRRLEGFGCTVLASTRDGGVSLEELLERSDFVTLHCPLTPQTRGLIDAEALGRMKPTAYLVNTARGPVVDTGALAAALHAGELAGAALDVTDPEPLPANHPLLEAPNLLVVPHIASATHATRGRMADIAVDNLLAGLAGEPMPHSVTHRAP
jgi:glyoxylate reductase